MSACIMYIYIDKFIFLYINLLIASPQRLDVLAHLQQDSDNNLGIIYGSFISYYH
jgi:hypothetical protein